MNPISPLRDDSVRMEEAAILQPDYASIVRAWQRRAPLARRILARIGLQGKLIACFLALLLIGLGGTCWLFVHESRNILGLAASSPARDAALHRAEAAIISCNAFAVLLAIPAVMLIVHRIFEPIRKLVAAADKIAAGELETRVAIYRPDAIGTLARSFNKMAHRVRKQQQSAPRQVNARLCRGQSRSGGKVRQRTSPQLEAANKRLNFEIAEKEDFVPCAISHDLG